MAASACRRAAAIPPPLLHQLVCVREEDNVRWVVMAEHGVPPDAFGTA
jgi:hypothetical protein